MMGHHIIIIDSSPTQDIYVEDGSHRTCSFLLTVDCVSSSLVNNTKFICIYTLWIEKGKGKQELP